MQDITPRTRRPVEPYTNNPVPVKYRVSYAKPLLFSSVLILAAAAGLGAAFYHSRINPISLIKGRSYVSSSATPDPFSFVSPQSSAVDYRHLNVSASTTATQVVITNNETGDLTDCKIGLSDGTAEPYVLAAGIIKAGVSRVFPLTSFARSSSKGGPADDSSIQSVIVLCRDAAGRKAIMTSMPIAKVSTPL